MCTILFEKGIAFILWIAVRLFCTKCNQHSSQAYSDMKLPVLNQLVVLLFFTELHLDMKTHSANTSTYTLLQFAPHFNKQASSLHAA